MGIEIVRELLDDYAERISKIKWIMRSNIFNRIWEHCPDSHDEIISFVKGMKHEQLRKYLENHKDLEDGEIQSTVILRERAEKLGVRNTHKLKKPALRRALEHARNRKDGVAKDGAGTCEPCEPTDEERNIQ